MKEIKIFLISGRARNGKDTVSNMIDDEYTKLGKKVCFIQLMRPLKNLLKDYFDWDGSEETKPRDYLQQMGTELIRKKLNMPNYFINRLTENIIILKDYYDIFLVTDVRLPLEIEELKNRFKNVISINVKREKFDNNLNSNQKVHYTEIALDNYDKFDYELINDNLEDLEIKVKQVVSEVEKNENND